MPVAACAIQVSVAWPPDQRQPRASTTGAATEAGDPSRSGAFPHGSSDPAGVQSTQICDLIEVRCVRVLTSLALSCVSNMVGRGRELQGEWPRSLYADHASFSA